MSSPCPLLRRGFLNAFFFLWANFKNWVKDKKSFSFGEGFRMRIKILNQLT
jgi:hypothetical protein